MTEENIPETTVGLTVSTNFRSSITRAMLEYWRGVTGDRAFPGWTDIQLIDIYSLAPHIVVRDVVDGGREFRCRFSGTTTTAVLGIEATGKLISDTYSPRATALILARYRRAMEAAAPVRFVGYVQAVEKNLPTPYEAAYLPLAGPDGSVGHIIVAYDFDYEPLPDEISSPK